MGEVGFPFWESHSDSKNIFPMNSTWCPNWVDESKILLSISLKDEGEKNWHIMYLFVCRSGMVSCLFLQTQLWSHRYIDTSNVEQPPFKWYPEPCSLALSRHRKQFMYTPSPSHNNAKRQYQPLKSLHLAPKEKLVAGDESTQYLHFIGGWTTVPTHGVPVLENPKKRDIVQVRFIPFSQPWSGC